MRLIVITDSACTGLTYDYLGRMTAAWGTATDPCAGGIDTAEIGGPAPYTESYTYDSVGNRRESGATTLYLPGMEIRLDTTTANVTGTRYQHITDTTVVVRTSAGTQFQIADHHGTGQAAIDGTTGELAYRRTTPFGTARGTQPTDEQWAGERGFVGGTEDDTTGYTHLGAREYDPDTGRFISPDPLLDPTDPQQLNAYAYSNNNPISYSDPSGTKFCSDSMCGAGADYVDILGNYHEIPGHNDGCGGCSGATDTTVSNGGTHKTTTTTNTSKTKTQQAQDDADDAKQAVIDVAEELGKILLDELGITDALDCFTTGDLGSCAATAATATASLIGGIGAKLIAKYAWRIKKLANLIDRVKALGAKLLNAIETWTKKSKALKEATEEAIDCNSFLPGTLVLMADGTTKPIQDLQPGDTVLATDPLTGQTQAQVVVATIIGQGSKDLVQLTIDTDDQTGDDQGVIIATAGHPFWGANLNQWINATDLQVGQWLRTSTGTWTQITATQHFTQTTQANNLTINNTHTYYVLAGNTPVLVHNASENDICRLTLGPDGSRPADGVTATRGDTVLAHEQEMMNEFGDRNGCATCGATDSGYADGHWTGDHTPPNKAAPNGPWTLYPQCKVCARQQGCIVNAINREWYNF